MSDEDQAIIKRALRAALSRLIAQEAPQMIERATHLALHQLSQECGGDRLYVYRPKARASRDEKIRQTYQQLSAAHSPRLAMDMLARREGLSQRQLKRICANPPLTQPNPTQPDQSPVVPPAP